MSGKLIVIEGMDGTGTTTQAKMLSAYFLGLGKKVLSSAEPTGSAIGQEIRRMLKGEAEKSPELLVSLALCFAADRMQHIHNTITPGLLTHDVVILDRYVLSSLVYQGLHLPTTFVKDINQFAVRPDLTFVLDLDVPEALSRIGHRKGQHDFYETPLLLEKIRGRYRHFYDEDPTDKVLVDASGTVEQVHAHLRHAVSTKFGC